MQIIVDDLVAQYHYLEKPKAPQIVMLHGWGDAAHSWLPMATELAKKYAVIVPDLPGFGGSQAPLTPWNLDDYAMWLAHFLKKLNLQPAIIIGHSNGGAIAIRGLATNVLQAERLVLLASAGIRDQQSGRKRLLRAVAKTGKVVTAPLPTSNRQKLRRKLYAGVGSDLLVAEHMQTTFKQIVAQDIQADAGRLELPTLLLYGEQDSATPVRYGELLRELIDGSTLEIITGADHFLHLDHQAQVLQLIEDFLHNA